MSDVDFQDTEDVIWWNSEDTIWASASASVGQVGDIEKIYNNAEAVTPDNSNDLSNSGVLYVGVGGDIKVNMKGIGTVTFKNVPEAARIIAQVERVFSTGTTATDIVVLF